MTNSTTRPRLVCPHCQSQAGHGFTLMTNETRIVSLSLDEDGDCHDTKAIDDHGDQWKATDMITCDECEKHGELHEFDARVINHLTHVEETTNVHARMVTRLMHAFNDAMVLVANDETWDSTKAVDATNNAFAIAAEYGFAEQQHHAYDEQFLPYAVKATQIEILAYGLRLALQYCRTNATNLPVPTRVEALGQLEAGQRFVVRSAEMFACLNTDNDEVTFTTEEAIRSNEELVPSEKSNWPEMDAIDIDLVILDQNGETFDCLDSWACDNWNDANALIDTLQSMLGCESEGY